MTTTKSRKPFTLNTLLTARLLEPLESRQYLSTITTPVPLTDESVIFADPTGPRYGQDIIALPDGSSVVTWLASDGDGLGVFAARVDPSGKQIGQTIPVNTFTQGLQTNPSIAPRAGGGFIVAWHGQTSIDEFGVQAQVFDADGNKIGPAITAASDISAVNQFPDAFLLPDGGFILTWASTFNEGHNGVHARRYDPNGGLVINATFNVNQDGSATDNDSLRPMGTALNDGSYVIAWRENNQTLLAQRFDQFSDFSGSNVPLVESTTFVYYPGAIAALPAGGFVIAWSAAVDDSGDFDIYAQRFNNSLAPAGIPTRVNTFTQSFQTNPTIAAMPDSGFVVAWASTEQDGSSWGVYGQSFDANASPRGFEFHISQELSGPQANPQLASFPDGRMTIAYSSQSSSSGDTLVRSYEGYHVNDAPSVHPLIPDPLTILISKSTSRYDILSAFDFNPGPGETDQTLLHYEIFNSDFFRFLEQPTISSNGTLSFTPAPGVTGSSTFFARAYDTGSTDFGGVNYVDFQFTINLVSPNAQPSITGINKATLSEDYPPHVFENAFTFDPGSPNETHQTANYILLANSNPNLFDTPPSIDPLGNLSVDIAQDAVGEALLAFIVQDSGGTESGGVDTSEPYFFNFTVNPENDAPSFIAQDPPIIPSDAGVQIIPNWATATPGPANESDQFVTFQVTNVTDENFFTKLPYVSSNGTLIYEVAPAMSGLVFFSVQATDSGPTPEQNFNNKNTSDIQTFAILVSSVNARPSITGFTHEVTAQEDSGPFFAKYEFNPGSPYESDQTGTFFISTSNPHLFAEPPTIDQDGFLRYTPAPNANGTAVITLLVQDSGGTADGGIDISHPFDVVINLLPVNDKPSFTGSDLPATNEDSGLQTIHGFATFNPGASNESDQTPRYITGIPYENPFAFFTQVPVVYPDGTLTYQVAPDVSGTLTFFARVRDSGPAGPGDENESLNQAFTITVNPVNDAPFFKADPIPAVNENTGPVTLSKWATGSPGPANESDQSLTYTVANSNASLFSIQPHVAPDGTLTYTPSPNAFGTSTISVTLTDSGGTANAGVNSSSVQNFTITVNHVPHPIINVTSTLPNLGNGVADDDLTPFTQNGTDFGKSYQRPGNTVRTFRVSNPGDQDLSISNFSLPAGFVLAEPLSSTIAPGKSDTFTIYLDTNLPGIFSGQVQFDTNASNASHFNFAVTGTVQAGAFHTFTSKTAAKDRTFTDDQNNKVVFNLIGSGTGTLFRTDTGQFLTLDISNTKTTSGLNITVAKNTKAGTGVSSIGSISVGSAGLASLNAANVNLTHSLLATANIKAVTLRDIGGDIQASITIEGASSDKTTFTLGAIHDLFLRTNTAVTSFKAQHWIDTNDSQDFFEASSLGSLNITGRAQLKSGAIITLAKLQGDFQADLSLTYAVPIGTAPNSPAAKPTVTSITVAGSVMGDWSFKAHKVANINIKSGASGSLSTSAGLGPVTIAGTADHLNIDAATGIVSFKAGHALSTNLTTKGNIGAITAGDYLNGSITAAKVASITTNGINGTAKVAGDFSADLLISGVAGSATLPSLGPVNIKGSVIGDNSYKGLTTSGDWIIAGGAGAIKIGSKATTFFLDVRAKDTNKGNLASLSIAGASNHVQVDVHGKSGAISVAGGEVLHIHTGQGVSTGDLTSFTSTKSLIGLNLNVDGAIGSISANDLSSTMIFASKIGTITSRAVLGTKSHAAVPSAWSGVDITLSGALLRTGQLTLGSVTIAGPVSHSHWSIARNAGPVSVGAFLFSALFVGVDTTPTIFSSPTKAQFTLIDGKTSTLGRFTVTGKGVSLIEASFDTSQVVAGSLPIVQLSLVNRSASIPNGIIAATKIGTYTRLVSFPPAINFKVNNKTAPGIFDTAGLYTLKIVG